MRPEPSEAVQPAPPCILIRKAAQADLTSVSQLAHRIWPVCFKGILTDHQIAMMLAAIYAPEALAEEMHALKHVFWVASVDGKDTGYASAYIEDDTVWIKKLYILTEQQGTGLGKKLIHTVLEHFADAACIALYVNRDNLAAQRFYEHIGFSVVDERPVKMGPYDFIDLVMVKNL